MRYHEAGNPKLISIFYFEGSDNCPFVLAPIAFSLVSTFYNLHPALPQRRHPNRQGFEPINVRPAFPSKGPLRTVSCSSPNLDSREHKHRQDQVSFG